ncbi:MAG: flagellar basal body rod protein FlgB [Pseudobdellovibrionaceae bacterium]
MTTENLSLFQAMNAKMNYLAQRQKVISQNIANADTPGYVGQDLNKVDFSKLVENIDHNRMHVTASTTNPLHQLPPDQSPNPKELKNKKPFEVSPDGNSVILEEQMIKSNDVQINYGLMVNLYRDNVDMIRTALGKGQ